MPQSSIGLHNVTSSSSQVLSNLCPFGSETPSTSISTRVKLRPKSGSGLNSDSSLGPDSSSRAEAETVKIALPPPPRPRPHVVRSLNEPFPSTSSNNISKVSNYARPRPVATLLPVNQSNSTPNAFERLKNPPSQLPSSPSKPSRSSLATKSDIFQPKSDHLESLLNTNSWLASKQYPSKVSSQPSMPASQSSSTTLQLNQALSDLSLSSSSASNVKISERKESKKEKSSLMKIFMSRKKSKSPPPNSRGTTFSRDNPSFFDNSQPPPNLILLNPGSSPIVHHVQTDLSSKQIFSTSSQSKIMKYTPSSLSAGLVIKEKYRCIVPYPPNTDYELELKIGDIVYVHKKREDGWFKGTLERNGKTGLFPGSFVEAF